MADALTRHHYPQQQYAYYIFLNRPVYFANCHHTETWLSLFCHKFYAG